MVKLCWMRNFYGNVDEYFYDMEQNRVYYIDLSDYNKTKIKFGPTAAILVAGPIATFVQIMLKNRVLMVNLLFLIFALICLVVGGIWINISYEKSEVKKAVYIRNNAVGMQRSNEQILSLLESGKKYRVGISLFAFFCMCMFFFSIFMYRTDHSVISVVMFYVSFYGGIIWLKMLAPIKIYALKKYLRKGDD